jgi:hypothetical protein
MKLKMCAMFGWQWGFLGRRKIKIVNKTAGRPGTRWRDQVGDFHFYCTYLVPIIFPLIYIKHYIDIRG